MKIDVIQHAAGYQEVMVSTETATISTGLMDKNKAASLAYELGQAAEILAPEAKGQSSKEGV